MVAGVPIPIRKAKAKKGWSDQVLKTPRNKCKTVWTSYGIAANFIPFLPKTEQVVLQNLNKFYYNIAVSRVQTAIAMEDHFLVWMEDPKASRKLIRFDSGSNVACSLADENNFYLYKLMTVFVKQGNNQTPDIYTFDH